jgi:predicted ester cyclase
MSDTNKALVRRYYDEVLNGRQLDRVVEFFANPMMAERVRQGCFSYFVSFPDLHCSIEELIAEGDRVFCRSALTGTQDGEYKGIAPTGRNVSAECAEVFRIEDGRFVGYWCQSDVAGITRQLTQPEAAAAAAR